MRTVTGESGNLFVDSEPPSTGERFDPLARLGAVEIERIVSSSHIEPMQYLQKQDEWVVLLRGEADMEISGVRQTLKVGDYVLLPARTPHTVWATRGEAVWLCIHVHPTAG